VAEKAVDVMYLAIQENTLNLGLLLDKYVLWWYNKKEKKWKCDPKVQVSFVQKARNEPQNVKALIFNPNIHVEEFRKKMENERLSIPSNVFPADCYLFYRDKINFLLETFQQMGFHVRCLPDKNEGLPLNWRLTINLGAASVYETSLLFHRNYSVPYIPGSAVKGVSRHWTVLKFSEVTGKDAKDIDAALSAGKDLGLRVGDVSFSDLIEIFGTQNMKGKVVFFDAIPFIEPNEELVILDVMNVHYKPYYEASIEDLKANRENAPGDWHSPVPIFFLAVERGTRFRFALASKRGDLVEKAADLLKESLKEIGVGAKTSAGYGYFEA